MPSHTSGLPPKALASLIDISGLMPFLPLTRLLSVRRVTPRISAALVTLRPRGSRQSFRTCWPGCGGFFILMVPSSLVVVNQIHVGRVLAFEAEDHAPVGADRDSPEAFQPPLQ